MSHAAGAGAPIGIAGSPPRGALTGRRLRARLRPLLMAGGVVALAAAAGAYWLAGGRIVSIDDSYISAAKVAVATDVSGLVATVAVHEGQTVRAGDELFRLDDRAFRIALAGARADLAQAALNIDAMKRDYRRLQHEVQAREAQVQSDQSSYDRLAGLVKGGAATKADTDDARFKLAADQQGAEALRVQAQVQLARLDGDADIDPSRTPSYQLAQARLDEAQRQLDHTVVRAPFDGIATQVDAVQPGMYLAASAPAFALVSADHVWATGNPKETELTWVRPGNHVTVTVDTYPGVSFDGVVESISPASGAEFSVLPAQNTSGNWVKVVQRIPLRVRLDRKPDAPPLRAGMSVVIDVDTGHTRSLSDLL